MNIWVAIPVNLVEQWKQEGLEKGLEKGRKKMAEMVLRMIQRKFGPLNESDQRRVLAAKERTLQRWGDRLIDAANVKEIFKH